MSEGKSLSSPIDIGARYDEARKKVERLEQELAESKIVLHKLRESLLSCLKGIRPGVALQVPGAAYWVDLKGELHAIKLIDQVELRALRAGEAREAKLAAIEAKLAAVDTTTPERMAANFKVIDEETA